MTRDYVDLSGLLVRTMFKYDSYNDRYRIERPNLDAVVGLLSEELERMKREEKKHG